MHLQGGQVPRRWGMALLLFTGLLVVYTLRVNMSVAAQDMRSELNWSEKDKGFVLSSFYWGYTVGQIPAAIIAQTYGAKWLFGCSISIPALLTLLVPTACRTSLGAALFIRALIGFFESASFPALFHLYPLWVPQNEKSFLIPFIVSGLYIGEVVGFSLSGVLVDPQNGTGGWPSVFYTFGLAGLLWMPFWVMLAHESPLEHPNISAEELTYLNEGSMLKGALYGQAFRDTFSHERDGENSRATLSPLHVGSKGQLGPPGAGCATSTLTDEKDRVYHLGDIALQDCGGKNSCLNLAPPGDDAVELHGVGRATHSVGTATTSSSKEKLKYNRVLSQEGNEGVQYSSSLDRACSDNGRMPHHHSSSGVVGKASATATTTSVRTGSSGEYCDGGAPGPRWNGSARSTASIRSEMQCDQQRMRAHKDYLVRHTPWKQLFTHPTAICLYIGNFQYGWMNFTLMSELPSFLTDVLGFDLQRAGVLLIFPYMALFVSSFCFGKFYEWTQNRPTVNSRGFLAMHCIGGDPWTADMVRKHAQTVAYLCSGIALVACGFMQRPDTAFCFVILTQIFFGANQAGLGCAYSDIAPNYSSVINTIGNTAGSVAGILGPIVIAALTDTWPGAPGWRAAFILTCTISCAMLLLWFRFVKAEIVTVLNTPSLE